MRYVNRGITPILGLNLLLYRRHILLCLSNPPPINTFAHALYSVTPSISTTGFLRRGKPTVMYYLSPGITMRSTIPAYSYRHGLNFIPGIVKTRIDCYSGISSPSLIVMAPGVAHYHVQTTSLVSLTVVVVKALQLVGRHLLAILLVNHD